MDDPFGQSGVGFYVPVWKEHPRLLLLVTSSDGNGRMIFNFFIESHGVSLFQ